MRIRPPACCAARHRCSQRRCARCSSWLDRRLPPSRLPGRGRRSAPARALLILPRAADRHRSGCGWWRQTARAWWISRPTCSCAGAPWHHLIAWLRLLSIDLQLDGAMSSPGPAAKLALKRQTGLMGGDMGLAATTAAAQAQRSAAAAQPAAAAAAAAAATGACDLQAFASQSLPVVPARSSTTGRPAAPPHPFFVAGRGRGRGRGAARGGARRGRGRGRGRGRASDGTGKYPCESCGERVKDRRTLKKSHYKEYTWVGADGEKVTKRLCKNNDWDQRQALDKLQKATTARHQPGQSALSLVPDVDDFFFGDSYLLRPFRLELRPQLHRWHH